MRGGPELNLNGPSIHLKRDPIRRVFLTEHRTECSQPFPASQVRFRHLSLSRQGRLTPETIKVKNLRCPNPVHKAPHFMRLDPAKLYALGQANQRGSKAVATQVCGGPDLLNTECTEFIDDRRTLSGAALIPHTMGADQRKRDVHLLHANPIKNRLEVHVQQPIKGVKGGTKDTPAHHRCHHPNPSPSPRSPNQLKTAIRHAHECRFKVSTNRTHKTRSIQSLRRPSVGHLHHQPPAGPHHSCTVDGFTEGQGDFTTSLGHRSTGLTGLG